MIRTVVSTEASTNTTVVNLDVQPLIIVIRCVYWTHWFARCFITMLAQNWYETGLDVREFPFPVSLNSYPFDGTTLVKVLLFVNRDVVFGLAGYHTRLTSSTFVYVNYHSPTFVAH